MRLKKDTIGSMLQGVSEQPPSRRNEGQNTSQVNMISDATSGLRRRSGLEHCQTLEFTNTIEDDHIYGAYLSTKDGYMHLLINTTNGEYKILKNNRGTLELPRESTENEYLANCKAEDIQTTSCSGVTYLVNTQQKIVMNSNNDGKLDPKRWGFLYIVAGTYDTDYKIEVTLGEHKSVAFAYKTPSGTAGGAASQSTPDYIAEQFRIKLSNWISAQKLTKTKVYRRGSYVTLFHGEDEQGFATTFVTENSSAHIVCSGQNNLQVESQLPPRLPAESDGYLCSVGGNESTYAWYRYNDEKCAWVETGAWDSPTDTETGTPLKLSDDGNFVHMKLDGRRAGNDDNNEVPHFMKEGVITGISTYTGRLVILSGAYVAMSATGKPSRFFRTTVSSSLGSDRVELASGSAQNTVYRQAVQYNKDLIMIGDDAQAVVPFSTTKGADSVALVVTSTMSCNSRVTPAQTLKTLLYPTKAEIGYSNILELTPSTVSSSLYSTDDATSHIPRYIKGDVRFITGNPNWGVNIIASYGDRNTLVVHEYVFDGDGKAQNAWHKWVFDRDVVWAYSGNDFVYILMKNEQESNKLDLYRIDPVKESTPMSVHLDYTRVSEVEEDYGYVPPSLKSYAVKGKMVCVYNEGELKGCQVDIKYEDATCSNFTLERITGKKYTGSVILGVKFESSVQPTSPITRNREGYAMLSNRERLLRFEIVAYNSGNIWADVKDYETATDFSMELSSVRVQSSDLELNKPLVAETPKFTIPCRTKPQSTQMTLRTDGIHDMHFVACDYIVKKEN